MSSNEEVPNWIFINKTPGRLARTQFEKFIVATHIGKRKQSRSRRLTLSISTPPFQIAKYAVEKCNQFFENNTGTPGSDRESQIVAASTSSKRCDASKNTGPLLCCSTHPQHPNLSPVCFKGNSDPFSSTSVGLSSFLWDVVQASFRFLVFSSHPSNPAQAYRTQLGDFTSSRMPIRDSITSDVGIHAILAAGYLVKATTMDSKHEEAALIQQSERYKLKCISRIRRELGSSNDLASVIALLRLLISLEFFTGDFKAAKTHLQGLKTICALNTNWGASTEDFLIMADIGIALGMLSKADMDPDIYDPGPRSAQAWDEALINLIFVTKTRKPPRSDCSALKRLGTEIDTLASSADEISETVWMLTNVIEPQESLFARATWWLGRRSSAVAARLLASYVRQTNAVHTSAWKMNEGEQVSTHAWTHALTGAICVVLILHLSPFSMEYVSEGNFSRVWMAIEPMLKLCSNTVLTESPGLEEDAATQDLRDVYFWAVYLCALYDDLFCARGHTQYSGWARQEFDKLCVTFNVNAGDVANTRLKRCVWNGGAMDEFLNKLMSDRSSRSEVPDANQKQRPLCSSEEWAAILWRHFVKAS